MYRRPGLTLLAVYSVPVVFLVLLLTAYTVVRWLAEWGGTADQITQSLLWLRNVAFTYFAFAALWYFASIVVLIYGYRNTRDIAERNQARWVIVGSILASFPFGYALLMAARNPSGFTGGAASWPLFVASACFTCAYAVGITRHRFLQFDQLLSSGLAYFLVSVLAAIIYCALVVTGMLLFGFRGPSLEQAAWVGGSALVLSISLDAARSRLSSYLDRRYRKDKTQIDQILQQLGGAVDQLIDAPTLANRLLQVAGDLQGYPRGVIYIREQGGGFIRAGRRDDFEYPEHLAPHSPLPAALATRITLDRLSLLPTDPVRQQMATLRSDVAVGLPHADQLLGLLFLGRAAGRPAEPTDGRLLASFAPVAALALAGAEVRGSVDTLNRELQAKVNKISDQQRRIFALQQQLIAQSRRFPAGEAGDPSPPTLAGEPAPAARPLLALEAMIGSSPALQQVLEVVPKVAANASAVLIYGESGTGKELLARAFHDLSPRSAGPYIKVHCAALAPGLLESELFGHVKGAFTGAVRDKPGRFEAADGGTLFLDEIGDISADVQTKLLRVLQEKTFERVGSNEPIHVDVRLVTATHQNLETLIRDGRFRADLFYRLNVITLELPALRERGEDVLELAHHFLRAHAMRCNKNIESIDDDALVALREYSWPGNIRELENVIERAVVVCDANVITLRDLPAQILSPGGLAQESPRSKSREPRPGTNAVRAARAARHAREKSEILQALRDTNWNRTEAATRLGMARSTLLSRMKKFGLGESANSG
ncbi:MAG: sigma-54-dependent Fis family transcriptional regulator [Gemmataceae bacterium]|nr:sigma-54-dependent Fis family transcriptional regulator [Gemmataceae bacterium]